MFGPATELRDAVKRRPPTCRSVECQNLGTTPSLVQFSHVFRSAQQLWDIDNVIARSIRGPVTTMCDAMLLLTYRSGTAITATPAQVTAPCWRTWTVEL